VRHLLPLFAILLYLAPAADALSADLNRDGVVDFDDFFLFADQFGLTGEPDAPDTVVVVVRDTVYIDPADTLSRSGAPIAFADPALEFVLRDLVGVAEGDLLTGDVDGITTLNLSGLNISLLDGLQHFTSLTTLSLTDNLIVDLSPLQGLANLKTITLLRTSASRLRCLSTSRPSHCSLTFPPHSTHLSPRREPKNFLRKSTTSTRLYPALLQPRREV
jgi:Leucine-rich repeat (LRR) protein